MPTVKADAWRSSPAMKVGPCLVAAILAAAAPASRPSAAADAGPAAAEVAAIRAAAAAYRTALEKGDAAAIRRAWTADGDIVDGWGNLLSAADATAADATAGGARPEIHVGETRLRFITPDVAVEDGTVNVVMPGTTAPLEGWFSAIWVKQEGGWKLAGIRESERPTALAADAIDDLDWMVGDWTLAPDDGDAKDAVPAMEMSVRWDAGHMFLLRDVRLVSPASSPEPVTIDVHQRIGWDPVAGRVRSWSFSTDGTRGEATWFRDGNSWIAKGTTIRSDGRQEPAIHIYSYDGKDRCLWRTMREPFAADARAAVHATWIRKTQGGGK